MSPDASSAATRPKVYAACEPCRKRKVRCSGTSPCTTCQRLKIDCHIDQHRRRRGPPPGTGSHRTTAAGRVTTAAESVATPTSAVEAQPASPSGLGRERALSFGFPYLAAYRDALCKILGKEDVFKLRGVTVSIDLALHLITVFCVSVNDQQSAVISVSRFLRTLLAGECSKSLCLAMCAVSVKFSRNRLLKQGSSKEMAEIFANEARNELEDQVEDQFQIDRVQCLAILAVFELNEGHNSQALYDLNTALMLSVVLRTGPLLSAEDKNAVDIVHHHLYIAEALCSLEHRTLRPMNARISPSSHEGVDDLGAAPDTRHVLATLITHLTRIQRLSRTGFTKQNPAPWSPDSPYMALREELDESRIRYPEETSFNLETFNSKLKQETGLGEYVLCSLTWHCCRIRLCRIFLPIPILDTLPPGQDFESQKRESISFPSAPETIINESIHMCNQSTKMIASICSRVLASGVFLMPPFLGFCCYQAALVLTNELRLRRRATFGESLGDLKVFFTVLGAIKDIFVGAERWMETLFQVHDSKSLLQDASLPGNVLFAQYFSRFDNITESSYMVSNDSAPQRWAKTVQRHRDFEETNQAELLANSPQQASSGKENDGSWTARYRKGIQSTLVSMKSPVAPSSTADIPRSNTPRRDILSFENTSAAHGAAEHEYQMQVDEESLGSGFYDVEDLDATLQASADNQIRSGTAASSLSASATSIFGPGIQSFDFEFLMQYGPPDSFMPDSRVQSLP